MKAIYLLLAMLLGVASFGQNGISQGLQQQTVEMWGNGNWQNSQLATYTNAPNGDYQHILGKLWDADSSAWQTYSQVNYVTNADSNISNVVNQLWDADSSSWKNSSKTTWAYNVAGQITSMTTQIWVDANWQNQSQSIYNYNSEGHLYNIVLSNWDAFSQSWMIALQQNYTLNSVGKPTLIVLQLLQGSLWADYTRTTNTYGSNGLLSQNLVEVKIMSEWQNSTRDFYTYDGMQRMTQQLTEIWGANFAWGSYMRTIRTYGTLGIDAFEKGNITLFPNPVKERLFISATDTINGVKVYGMDGHLYNIPSDSNSYDVGMLSDGLYIINVETEKGTHITKFIKK